MAEAPYGGGPHASASPDGTPATPALLLIRQTYEGGLGGEPWTEAHGGYTFCGLAALALIDRSDALDIPRLTRWATQRQVGGLVLAASVLTLAFLVVSSHLSVAVVRLQDRA